MARALITFERATDGGWKPTIAWLATPTRLEAKELPGDARRTNWMNAILGDASQPRRDPMAEETGTWEDWVDWALNALANGSNSWAVEVEPELTVQRLYEREVLQTEPGPIEPPNLKPQSVIPDDLGGYRKVTPR